MLKQEFTLPFPPSVNKHTKPVTIWSKKKQRYVQRKIKTKICRNYLKNAVKEIWAQRKCVVYPGMVEVNIAMYPPDRRHRDTDNILKALFDALTKGGIIRDDYYIQKHGVERFDNQLLNCIKITIAPREEQNANNQ